MKRDEKAPQRRNEAGEREPGAGADTERLVHELRVHQVELEAQNEELRRAQAALEEARDRYRDLYDFAPVGYFTVDTGGIIQEVNLTGCGLMGADAARIVGRPFVRFVATEFEDAYRAHLASALEGAPGRLCELRIVPAHREPFDARLVSAAVPGVAESRFCRTAVSDITAQKSAEKALRRARDAAEAACRVLQLANDAAEIGTWAWDLPDGVFRWDERCRALVGLPPGEEGTYERFLAAVCPEDRTKVKEAVAQSAAGKGDCNVEYRVPAPGGGVRWIASRGRVVRGQPDQLVGVAMDVTRRKEYEAALKRASAAEAASRAKSEFLALASHELHTPLNIALGFTGLLLEEVDGPLNPAQRRSVEKVDSNCRGLVAIADAILDLSRLQLGDASAVVAPFRLRESIRAGLEPFSGRARGKGLAFSWTVSQKVPDELSGDAGGLLQVLGLLVDNAIKFTAHGEIEVAVGRNPDLAGRVCLEVAVRDTGPGVPPEKRAAIFRPFEQAEAPDTRSSGGMGLGLAIASALVAHWGGRIWLESEAGRGSVFRFTACLTPVAAGEPS